MMPPPPDPPDPPPPLRAAHAGAFGDRAGDVAVQDTNDEACASFARYLREAEAAGVQVMARRVRWGEGDDLGKAFDAGPLDVRFV